MTKTKIKLCGMTRPEDIRAANALNPDYIGLVFYKRSRRYVDPETARTLSRELKGACPVGVFVNESREEISRIYDSGAIRAVQLHGGEDNRFIKELRASLGCEIIKAFRMSSPEDIRAALDSEADIVLLDSGMGSGEAFDHLLAVGVKRPYFLAGGLDSENVGRAIRLLRPYGVDASSGLETDGVKDPLRMARFVAAVRKDD